MAEIYTQHFNQPLVDLDHNPDNRNTDPTYKPDQTAKTQLNDTSSIDSSNIEQNKSIQNEIGPTRILNSKSTSSQQRFCPYNLRDRIIDDDVILLMDTSEYLMEL